LGSAWLLPIGATVTLPAVTRAFPAVVQRGGAMAAPLENAFNPASESRHRQEGDRGRAPVVTDANTLTRPIHNCMPVICDNIRRWLAEIRLWLKGCRCLFSEGRAKIGSACGRYQGASTPPATAVMTQSSRMSDGALGARAIGRCRLPRGVLSRLARYRPRQRH
jgi:hypothetical protein